MRRIPWEVLLLVGCRGSFHASTSSAESSTSSTSSTSSAEASTSSTAESSTSSPEASDATSSAEASTSIDESSDTGPGCAEPYGPCSVADDCCEGLCYASNQGGTVQWCASPCLVDEDCPEPPAGAPSCLAGACTLRCDELGPSPDCPPSSTCNGYACGW